MSLGIDKFFVILAGLLIMLTVFASIQAISSSQKKGVAGISKTSEPSTSSTSSTLSTQDNFQYPNAATVSSTQNRLHLVSTDSPKAITDWYKQKLSNLGYSITNFVATSNNDNIENKLQVIGVKKISVEISRGHGESQTDIKVEFN